MYTLYIGYGWGDKTVNGDYMCGTYPLAGAALVAVRSVVRPNLCIYFRRLTSRNILRKPLILSRLQHSTAVGVGFIPTLAAAGCYLDSCPTLVGRG